MCGVNQKLVVEALSSVRRGTHKPLIIYDVYSKNKTKTYYYIFQGAKDQSSTQHAAIANHKPASKSFELPTDNDNLGTTFLNFYIFNVCILCMVRCTMYDVRAIVHQLMKISNCYLFVKRNLNLNSLKGFCMRLKGAITLIVIYLRMSILSKVKPDVN